MAQQGSRGTSGGDARPGGPPPRPVVQSKMAATMKKAVSTAGPGSGEPWPGCFGETRDTGSRGSEEMRYLSGPGHGMRSAGARAGYRGAPVLSAQRQGRGRASPQAPNRFLHPGMSGPAPLWSALNRPGPTTLRAPSVWLVDVERSRPERVRWLPGFS